MTLFSAQKIILNDALPHDRLVDTLVHEIIHYASNASGFAAFVDLTVKPGVRADWEETFIRLVAPWIIQFAKDNCKPLVLHGFGSGAV